MAGGRGAAREAVAIKCFNSAEACGLWRAASHTWSGQRPAGRLGAGHQGCVATACWSPRVHRPPSLQQCCAVHGNTVHGNTVQGNTVQGNTAQGNSM